MKIDKRFRRSTIRQQKKLSKLVDWVMPVAVVSSRHLSDKDIGLFMTDGKGPLYAAEYAEGWMIWFTTEPGLSIMDEMTAMGFSRGMTRVLRQLFKQFDSSGRKEPFTLAVRFDRDATKVQVAKR